MITNVNFAKKAITQHELPAPYIHALLNHQVLIINL